MRVPDEKIAAGGGHVLFSLAVCNDLDKMESKSMGDSATSSLRCWDSCGCRCHEVRDMSVKVTPDFCEGQSSKLFMWILELEGPISARGPLW